MRTDYEQEDITSLMCGAMLRSELNVTPSTRIIGAVSGSQCNFSDMEVEI